LLIALASIVSILKFLPIAPTAFSSHGHLYRHFTWMVLNGFWPISFAH
jgi:hypothetical protein